MFLLSIGGNMDNTTIGILLLDIGVVLTMYQWLGPIAAIGSIFGAAFYFLVLR